MKLDVLACSKCGAPLVLGTGDTTKCRRCDEENIVPEAHRRLRELREKDAALRTKADALFAMLDRPPSMVAGVLAMTFDLNMFAFLIVYGVPVALAAVLWGLDATNRLAAHLHRSENEMPFLVLMFFVATILLVLLFVPRAIGVYANRRAAGRQALVQALAAKVPLEPGGPSLCRECGAPLEVPSGVIVCNCIYCDAENAVRVRTKLLAQTKKVVASLARSVEDAVKVDASERHDTRKKLFSELGRYAFRTYLLAGLFALSADPPGRPKHGKDEYVGMNEGGPGPIGIIAMLLLVGLFIFFIFRSMAPDDAGERRSGNPAPEWVRFAGPVVFWIVLYNVRVHHC